MDWSKHFSNLPQSSFGGSDAPPKNSVARVKGIEKLSSKELAALYSAAKALGMHVDWLAAVMSFETAGTFSPSILNAAGSGAFGLIQFMPSTAQGILKTATKQEAVDRGRAMSFSEQLKKMVVPYFKGHKYNNLNDVYLKVFFPAAMGKPDTYVVGAQDGTDFQQKVYAQNRGFDSADKGYITRADITKRINSVLALAEQYPRLTIVVAFWTQVLFGVAVSSAILYANKERIFKHKR